MKSLRGAMFIFSSMLARPEAVQGVGVGGAQ